MDKISLFESGEIESISDREALDLIAECILGPDWHVVDPMSREQVNVHMVKSIIEKYDIANNTYMKQNWNKLIGKISDKLKVKVR